jgi:hypothetical protein
MDLPVGSACCCGCPWVEFGLDDPTSAAVAHHEATRHPTVAKPRPALSRSS